MEEFITHVHVTYSHDGWHNPDCVRKWLEKKEKKNVVVELLAHNSLLWTKLYPEASESENIVKAIEFGFKDTDVVVAGENLDELAKYFPIFDPKVKRMLDISLEEGMEILKEVGVEYIYFPHPTAPIAGAVKNGYEYMIPDVDGIEVWNGSISFFPHYYKEALALAEKYPNKTRLAGLDTHLGLIALNSACNLVEVSSKDEIYEAVRKNKLKPHKNLLYPFYLSKDYVVLAYSIIEDLFDRSSGINLSNFLSLIKQLY